MSIAGILLLDLGKIRKTESEVRKMMLMKKSGRKKCATCVILTVGALAAVGAIAVSNKGKQMMSCFKDKMKSMLSKAGISDCCNNG